MQRIDVVSVLAGGWSAAAVDKTKLPGFVIGINDAAILAPVHAAVSMDRLWTENRWPQLIQKQIPTYIRASALKNIREKPSWLHPFENDNRGASLSDDPATLNGNNSGFCGFNLAYTKWPFQIRLYGFDMGRGANGEAYWFQPYPWARPGGGTGNKRYQEWVEPFRMAAEACRAAGIDVVNMSQSSAIPFFRKEQP